MSQFIHKYITPTSNSGASNRSYRSVHDLGALGYSGKSRRVRIWVEETWSTSQNWDFTKMYIGLKGDTGPYDFDGNQVEVLFDGTSGGAQPLLDVGLTG